MVSLPALSIYRAVISPIFARPIGIGHAAQRRILINFLNMSSASASDALSASAMALIACWVRHANCTGTMSPTCHAFAAVGHESNNSAARMCFICATSTCATSRHRACRLSLPFFGQNSAARSSLLPISNCNPQPQDDDHQRDADDAELHAFLNGV